MGPEVPSRARRALPALHRSENEDGRRPSKCSRLYKKLVSIQSNTCIPMNCNKRNKAGICALCFLTDVSSPIFTSF